LSLSRFGFRAGSVVRPSRFGQYRVLYTHKYTAKGHVSSTRRCLATGNQDHQRSFCLWPREKRKFIGVSNALLSHFFCVYSQSETMQHAHANIHTTDEIRAPSRCRRRPNRCARYHTDALSSTAHRRRAREPRHPTNRTRDAENEARCAVARDDASIARRVAQAKRNRTAAHTGNRGNQDKQQRYHSRSTKMCGIQLMRVPLRAEGSLTSRSTSAALVFVKYN
jgi:hypothetical protein